MADGKEGGGSLFLIIVAHKRNVSRHTLYSKPEL
jgi:hypothetical protein